VSDFADVTTVRRRGDAADGHAVYDVELDPGWAIGGKPNGGYLLAILARAGCEVVDTVHPLAVSGHFLRAPNGGPAEVRTEVIRNGRRASTSRASLWQDEKLCIDATVTSGELHDVDAEWTRKPPPVMPAPEECVDPRHPHFRPELFDHVELRLDPTTAPFPDPTGEAVMRYWLRLRDLSPADPVSLVLAVDAGPPTVFNLQRYGWAPTVELTVLLRGLPAPGWLRCESTTRMMADGWFDEEASVWDSTGRLVAQSRQLALVGERPPK
jgi:acyl-CoA thioesterase